jgi:hypothetical protein
VRIKNGTTGKIISAWTSPMTFAATYIKFTQMRSSENTTKKQQKKPYKRCHINSGQVMLSAKHMLAIAPVKSYLMKWSTCQANGFSTVHTFRTDVAISMRRAIAIEVRKARIIITVIKTEAA